MASDLFNDVKLNVSFEGVCKDHGLTFNAAGQTLCPFHDEETSSFHNYGTHGYCFGCGKIADAIDVEVHFTGLSPYEAALSLAKRQGIQLPQFSKPEREKFNKQAEAYKLLERVAKYANQKIKQHPAVMEFLKKKGLDENDIDRYLIGYVGDENPISNKLKDKKDIDLAEEIGLIKRSDNGSYYDHFKNRIIFPIWDTGRIVYLTGRAFPEGEPKYLHLKNTELIQKQIAFSENLRKEKCVIVEGVTDAIVFNKVDVPSCGLLGTNLGEGAKQSLANAKARLYLCMDNDDAGQTAAYRLARKYHGYTIDLGFDQDPDEILAEKKAEAFKEIAEKAISEAKYYLDLMIEKEDKIKALSEISKLDYDSDKEIWIKRLAKRQKITEKSLQKDLKRIEKQANSDSQVKKIDNEGTAQYTAVFDGLVDLVNNNGRVGFLVKDNDKLEIKDSVNIDGETYYPPPRNRLPTKLLLPRADEVIKHYSDDSDSTLFDDLIQYHKNISELPGDEYYELLVAWDFHTYLLDNKQVQYSPYLWLFAIPERGKSRTGKGAIYVSYRGIHVESLRDAYLIRVASDLEASLFFDAMDIWKKAEKAGSEDILLQRFEKGATVPRVLYPEKGAHKDTKYFDIFGATIIGTNEPVHNILETRAVLVSMPESLNDYEQDVTPELALPYKERLVAFRARNLNKGLPQVKKPVKGRLGDILKPLLQVVKLVKPDKEKDFRKLIGELDKERKIQKSDSLEARILSTIISSEDQVDDSILHIKSITDKYNESVKEKFEISPNKTGWRLKAMGFKKGKDSQGAYIEWDKTLIEKLTEKYGLVIDSDPETTEEEEEKKDTPPHSEKDRHKRHNRHLINDDSGLESDDLNDDLSTSSGTSEDRHSVSTYSQKKNDDHDDNDDLSNSMSVGLFADSTSSQIQRINLGEKGIGYRFTKIGNDGKPRSRIIEPDDPNFNEVERRYAEQSSRA